MLETCALQMCQMQVAGFTHHRAELLILRYRTTLILLASFLPFYFYMTEAPQNTGPRPEGGTTQPKRLRPRKRNGATKTSKPSDANSDSKERNGGKPPKRTSRQPKKPKARDPAKDYKYLEVKKLIRHIEPLTVNGIPPEIIQKRAHAHENGNSSPSQNYVEDYVLKFITSQPDQPIHLSFQFAPSDPDFPYNVEMVKISLSIPPKYPYSKDARPSIYVLNDDIPRGFAVNLEIGFRRIAAAAMGVEDEEIELVEGKGLLSQIKTLDKYLEVFLKQEKKETIKFVKSKKRDKSSSPSPTPKEKPVSKPSESRPVESRYVELRPVDVSVASVSSETARERARLIQEMNDKFGRETVKVFKKSALENKYKVILPIPMQKDHIPLVWQKHGKVEVFLHVPSDYPEHEATLLMPPNFTKNILIGYKDMQEANQIHKQVLAVEKNIERNYRNAGECGPQQKTLICVINWLYVHLGYLCMDAVDFEEWKRCVGKERESRG